MEPAVDRREHAELELDVGLFDEDRERQRAGPGAT